ENGAVVNSATFLLPAAEVCEFVRGDGSVAEARGGCLLEGVFGEREVRLAHLKRATSVEPGLCGLNVRVEISVDEYVPDRLAPFASTLRPLRLSLIYLTAKDAKKMQRAQRIYEGNRKCGRRAESGLLSVCFTNAARAAV